MRMQDKPITRDSRCHACQNVCHMYLSSELSSIKARQKKLVEKFMIYPNG